MRLCFEWYRSIFRARVHAGVERKEYCENKTGGDVFSVFHESKNRRQRVMMFVNIFIEVLKPRLFLGSRFLGILGRF